MGTFDAFGVRFASTFLLPEVPDEGGGAGAPAGACALARGAPDEPARRFSGPCDPPTVARTSLGRTERGVAGDLLLAFGAEASFWISPGADEVVCGVAGGGDGWAWRRFLLDTVCGSVALARGFEGLHAGAVLGPAGVVAVAAGEGGGKSSLVGALLATGLPLFTDDLLMLSAGGAVAHPGPPLMNRPRADGGEDWVTVPRPPVGPAPVAAVVLLARGGADLLTVERLPPNPMDLLPLSLQGGSTPERRRSRFDACAGVAASAAVLRLAAPRHVPPEALAAAVLHATTGS